MLAGQKAYKDGYQVSLFPLDYMNCTQRGTPGDMSSYSHCCTYACDWGDPDTSSSQTNYPVYAPFDGYLDASSATNHRAYFYSTVPVLTPLGHTFVSLELVHDDIAPVSGYYSQGDIIYHTGTAGNAFGEHVHLDQADGQNEVLTNSGYSCTGSSTGACWTLPNTKPPYSIFYLTGDETIVNLRGMIFQTITDYSPTPTGEKSGMPLWVKWLATSKKYNLFRRGR